MNLKSLVIGSAAATVMTGSAMAADAIVYADPEPMEYVRICDVYGAGFFYIPGTETCLKIGGYVRFEVGTPSTRFGGGVIPGGASGYSSFARLALQPDVRSETEWGTLRAYSDLYIQYDSFGGGSVVDMEAAFIEIIGGVGTLRIGKADTPYSRFFNLGGLNLIDTVFYPYANSNEISYSFETGGFSGFIAAVDDQNPTWSTNFEGGLKYGGGWGSLGAMVGYHGDTGDWGASAALTGNFGAVTGKLQAFYSSDRAGVGSFYAIPTPIGTPTDWSVLASLHASFTPTVGAAITAQWYNQNTFLGTGDAWLAQAEIQYTPIENLAIVPSVQYTSGGGANSWAGLLRVERAF